MSDLAYVTSVIPASPVTLPALPYPPESILGRFPEVPSLNEHSAVITLSNASNPSLVCFTAQLGRPAISTDSVTVSFDAATTADEAVIRAFGGIESTPPAIVNLTPHLRINDTISVTAQTTVASGTDLTLDVAVFLPSATTARHRSTIPTMSQQERSRLRLRQFRAAGFRERRNLHLGQQWQPGAAAG